MHNHDARHFPDLTGRAPATSPTQPSKSWADRLHDSLGAIVFPPRRVESESLFAKEQHAMTLERAATGSRIISSALWVPSDGLLFGTGERP
jgi:hypothetical protein